MSQYTGIASRALSTLARKGAAVTFTLQSAGTYDETTDTYSGASTATVTGYAIEDEGDPIEYQRLELIQQSPATLLFGPSMAGEIPPLGSVVTWAGTSKTVFAVAPIRPDGTCIVAEVIVA